MATIITRAGKGTPLTHPEVDANFTNLNTDKLESGSTAASLTITSVDINGGTIDGAVIGGAVPAAGTFTTITVSGTVDGRDVAADGTKLDGIEAGADVTDTANVTAAGALMDSELTNEAAVKALNQGVATTDSPTFAGLTLGATALTATASEINVLDGITATTSELNTLDGITATTAQLNSVGQLSGRNIIINGSGRINQRGYVSGTAIGGANEYTLDRWRVVTSGQSLTFTGTDAGRTMTAPAGGVEQVIEGVNIVGGTYVISFTGTATCTVDGVTRASGDTFTLTANTDATVRFSGGTFTDVQIELGSIATTFEQRLYNHELSLCHRYYEARSGDVMNLLKLRESDRVRNFNVSFKVTKRAVPTITLTSVTLDGAPSMTANAVTVNGFRVQATPAADTGAPSLDAFTVSAEL